MSQERSLARSSSIIGASFSTDTALAAASALLTGLGFEDLQPSILATEQTYQAKTQLLMTALHLYLEHPHNTAYQQQLAALLSESIVDLKAEIARFERQQQKYQREVTLESSSVGSTTNNYLSQAKSWVLGQVKYFFGSTAAQQVEKYADLIVKREALLKEVQGLLTELASLAQDRAMVASSGTVTAVDDAGETEVIELDRGPLKSPMSRRLLQVTSINTECCYSTGQCDVAQLINGIAGLVLEGEAAGYQSAYRVAGVGDINGDGIRDLVIGAHGADPAGLTIAGNTYVVFGSRNSSAWGSGRLNFSSLMNGIRGFVLQGENAIDISGVSVSGAGDINDDGVDDLVLGAFQASPGGRTTAGNSYVIFGSRNATAWGSGRVNLSSLVNGVRGFVLQGEMPGDYSGQSVKCAGDINGDGIVDLLVGAVAADPVGRTNAGNTYVIFGNRSTSAWGNGRLDLSTLANGMRGFALQGEEANDQSSWSLSSAGDINSDGIDDFAVGAHGSNPDGRIDAGNSYVIFGSNQTDAWGNGRINLTDMADGRRGFVVQGEAATDISGFSVSGAGDINGDGVDDVVVGAPQADSASRINSGASYVVFGNRSAAAWGNGRINLTDIANGQRGFVLQGEATSDLSGYSVSAAGDVNSDGIDDLLVAAYRNSTLTASIMSNTYIVFGSNQSQAWGTGRLELASLMDGQRGVFLEGEAEPSMYFADMNGAYVNALGDFNGDGIDDIVRGVRYASPAGRIQAGSSYIFFGYNASRFTAFGSNSSCVSPFYGPEFQVNTYTPNSQQTPRVGLLSSGDFVVTWSSWGPDGSELGVYAQRYSSIGVAQGSEFRVNTYATSSQYESSVVGLNSGDFVMCWSSNGQDATWPDVGIYAQRFSSIGTPLGTEFSASTYKTGDQFNSQLSALNSGEFLIAWTSVSTPGDGSTYGVSAQRYNASGVRQGSEFRVNTYVANQQVSPNIASLSSGDFVITWSSNGQDGSNYGVYAQRYSSTAVPQGTEYQVNTYVTNDQINTGIAALVSGDFVVVWQSNGQDGSGLGVYGRRYSATGIAQGPEFQVNTYTAGDQSGGLITKLSSGGFVVVWNSNGQDGSGWGVYGRRYSATAIPLGAEFRVTDYTIGNQITNGIAGLNSGGFVVTWQSFGQDGSDNGIYARIFRQNAAPVLAQNQLSLIDNQTLIITPGYLNATDPDIDQDAAYVSHRISILQQGRFELLSAPGIAINNFTQSQINSNQVRFVHSGSNIAPSYQVTVTDGELSTPAQWSTISFNRRPVIVQNRLAINQGQRVTFTVSELTVSDDQLPGQLLYLVSNALQGQFELTTAAGIPIAQFTQAQVNGGTIQFMQDGGALTPSYQLRVSDGVSNSTLSTANVTFYRRPQWLTLPVFSLAEGDTMVVSTGVINVLEDYPDPLVWFNITALQYGQFNLVSPVATNISQFNFDQLKTGRVRFQHDGGEFAPSYDLTLFDPYFSLLSVSSNITLISVNDVPVLVQNRLSILQGQTVTFNSSNLLALDPDNSEDELSYYVSNIQRGVFFSSTPLSPLYSFTQGNISRGEIQFIHDNSAFPPYYQVTVSDGALSTPLQTVIVTFNGVNHPPLLLTAVLSVSEGQSVVLTPSQFAASDTDTPSEQVTFLISNITHGRFEFYSIPGVGLDQFSMQDIQQNTIRFVHDGSEVAPTFTVAVTDGVSTTASRPAIVSYTPVNNTPVLVNNTLALSEGGTVTLTSTFLSATDRDNPAGSLLFLPTQVQQGRFELVSNAGRSLTSFSQQQVTDGQVRFIHDGGEVAPSYQMAVSDGLLSSPPQAVAVDYTPINDAPRIVLNQLAIAEGGSAVLSSSQLLIEDPDSSSTQLLITPSAIQAGQFEQVFNPGISLTNFNYQNVQTGFIRFVHNGSEVPAAYTLTVNDGNLSSAPVGAVITYTPVNDAPVLTRNRLTLSEGDTLTLSSDDLAATDSDDVPEGLLFTVSQLQQGRFTDTMTGASILSFNQQALDSGQINFTHDGSQAAPTYFISVSDGRLASPAQSVLVNFTAINDAPSIVVNQLSITQGQAVLLDSGDLRATDEETPADDLLLTASQVKNGHFEYVADPGRPVSTFSQDKIRKADIRFVSDGSSRPPSYVFEVSDGQLDSTLSNATINFNPVPATPTPSGLSTQEIVSLLSTLGSVGLTIAGYLWWRNKTAEHRRGHDFANHLRKLLNLEYYDFTKGAGDVYKLKINDLIQQINTRHDDFYAHLTDEQRQAFALCVAGLMVQKELLARSGNASGLFNWWLCFSMGWSNQLKLKEMDKAATAIGDAAVTAWKAETRPLERWSYKPRGAREKIGMFFAASNCTSSRPQSGMLAEVHRASEYKSRSAETVGAMEAGEGVELDTLQSPSPIPAGRVGRGSGFFDRSEGIALRHELEMQKQKSEKQEQQLTAIHEKLDSVLVHLAQPR